MTIKYFYNDVKNTSKSNLIMTNLKWIGFTHTLHMLFLFRLGQDLHRIPLIGRFFSFLIEYVIRILYASDISCRAKIDAGFVIMHGHDIVIGSHVVIGKNCIIFNGVTLGNKNLKVSSVGEQPTIGDNVTIATGAKILGGIILGDNVVVGANAVVLKSYPANLTLVGVPARVAVDNNKNIVTTQSPEKSAMLPV